MDENRESRLWVRALASLLKTMDGKKNYLQYDADVENEDDNNDDKNVSGEGPQQLVICTGV